MRAILLVVALSACGTSEKKPEPESDASVGAGGNPGLDIDTTGLPAPCKKYVERFAACTRTLPADGQSAFADALQQTVAAWREASGSPEATVQLTKACEAAFDAAKSSMGSQCSGMSWD